MHFHARRAWWFEVIFGPTISHRIAAAMEPQNTTLAIQNYLDDLANLKGDSPAEPVIGGLVARSAERLQRLCAALLHRSYPRLTQPPLNLETGEMLSSVVERLLKAMREVRPQTVR